MEAKIAFIANRYVNLQKGFEFKTKEDKYRVDLILQQFRETILLCELEFARNPFLMFNKDKDKVIPTYGNIHIPPRRYVCFNKNPNMFYLRFKEFTFQMLTEKSLTYTNIGNNIINLPRDPQCNKFSSGIEERFFSDDFTTKYHGLCGNFLDCLNWISRVSNIPFLRKKGVNKKGNFVKTFQVKLSEYLIYIKEKSNQEV